MHLYWDPLSSLWILFLLTLGLGITQAQAEREDDRSRQLELVDLMESGKTFVFAKYLITFSLPEGASYKQRPASSMSRFKREETSGRNAEKDSELRVKSRAANRRQLDARFVLRSPSNLSLSEQSSSAQDPLGIGIEPVAPAHDLFSRRPPTIAELTGLLIPSDRDQPLSSEAEGVDPLITMTSELQIDANAINKTLIDCFMVDLDKRYNQRLAMEGRFRPVARTRRISFPKMLALTTECRRLSWRTIRDVPSIEGQLETAASSLDPSSAESSSNEQPNFGINSWVPLLGSWLGSGQESGSSDEALGPSLASKSEPTLSTSPQQASAGRPPAEAQQVDAVKLSDNNGSNSISYQEDRRQTSYLNMGLSMITGIVPNTLWCGLGDRASNYSELGAEYKLDSCCRSHDHCAIRLKPFSSDYGLVNWSVSSRLHCDCDEEFNACLQEVNTTLSNVIRTLYFRFVGLQCIDVQGTTRLRPQNITLERAQWGQ